ncbi:unnamed protein product [Trichogramma brassicae]|uniref:Uncharacterized protein n=1 Tax=Trichogramma brassicae TaxID=86971 RepID=A0A6H5J346_9HYME|nr:unnamed protein product [Trichogramma brassicae]
MMYSPDKMMSSKGLHGTPISAPGCFPSGRYSPSPYRTAPDPMAPPPRRCMPNPTKVLHPIGINYDDPTSFKYSSRARVMQSYILGDIANSLPRGADTYDGQLDPQPPHRSSWPASAREIDYRFINNIHRATRANIQCGITPRLQRASFVYVYPYPIEIRCVENLNIIPDIPRAAECENHLGQATQHTEHLPRARVRFFFLLQLNLNG